MEKAKLLLSHDSSAVEEYWGLFVPGPLLPDCESDLTPSGTEKAIERLVKNDRH